MADNKKISEMSQDEIRAMMKPVGIPGLPYPMAKVVTSDNGMSSIEVGLVESAQKPLIVYTDQPIERVNGMLFRQMPIPGMMFMVRDLLKKIAPDSKNRILSVLGDAAFGKSHMFKLIGGMVSPLGPISVDCGGMNMREIFFRTVIDYGQGVREQFDKRVASGSVSRTSLDTLEAEFPNSVIEKDGRTMIDWEAVGKPRQKQEDGKWVNDEDRGDAAARAANLLKAIYDKEGIDVQSNAFGIKMVPGEWFESLWSGRPLFLDEFNKSKKGTLDAFQTALQFANGELDECTVPNPMAAAADPDSPKSLTMKRSDVRMGWFIGVAGNDSSDGDTTQELSTSMLTRLNTKRIGNPSLGDWEHRISQVWTGLPLSTLYTLFEKTAKAKPAEFSKFLTDMRELGLTAQERQAIPQHEMYFLRHFQDTVQAIKQVAKYYNDRLKLSNPESDMFNKSEYRDLSDEVSAHGDDIFVSFRKVIADFNNAIQSMPDVLATNEAHLELDLSKTFKEVDLSAIGRGGEAWRSFGANMVRAIQEDIANDTIRMPRTNAALNTLCATNGIYPPNLKEAKMSKDARPLPELLKYDALSEYGGTEELSEVRSVLIACLKSLYPNLKQTDENIIPLASLGEVMMQVKRDGTPEDKHAFVVPNANLNSVEGEPIVVGKALPVYLLDNPMASEEFRLVDFRTVLAGLAVPEYAKSNRRHIWPVDLDEHLDDKSTAEVNKEKGQQDAMDAVKGKSKWGFGLAALAAVNAKKEPVYLYVLEDTERDKIIVIGPEDISSALRSEALKNGVQYVVKGEQASIAQINDFLTEGATFRCKKGDAVSGSTNKIIEDLIQAFSALCDITDDSMTVEAGTTLGDLVYRSDSSPAVFTSIVTPLKPA